MKVWRCTGGLALAALCLAVHGGAQAQIGPFFGHIGEAYTAMSSRAETVFGKPVAAGEPAYLQTWALDWDNDVFKPHGTDQDYTNGIRITYRRARKLFQADGAGGYRTNAYGVHVAQNMYTPRDVRLFPAQVDRTDHPYGAWLHVGLWKEDYRSDGSYWRYEVNAGCIGPCALGEPVQKAIHKEHNDPKGWDLQVRNEIGLQARIEHAPATLLWAGNHIELVPRVGADLGNVFFQGHAGATLRAGRLVPFHCGSELQPIVPYDTGGVELSSAALDPKLCGTPVSQRFQLFGFLRMDGKVVGYNALLQGPLINDGSPHTVGRRRFVVDMDIGLAFQAGSFMARYSIGSRSTEVAEQEFALRRYRFGRLHVSWTW
ncbi:MAG: lipid A deacylase LpxR family protein [Betaproteobacteria bacterium]